MAKAETDLLTLPEVAMSTRKTTEEILEFATRRQLSIGTLIVDGKIIFLIPADLHRFIAKPDLVIKISDLEMTYNECSDPDSDYSPAPNVLLQPPISDVSIATLRITKKEASRFKKTLQLSGELKRMRLKRPLSTWKNFIAIAFGVVSIIYTVILIVEWYIQLQ